MSKHVEPALTPEEWAGVVHGMATGGIEVVWSTSWMETEYDEATGGNRVAYRGTEDHSLHLSPNTRPHALAALCLHGQPLGFTREDVDMLRRTADTIEDYAALVYRGEGDDEETREPTWRAADLVRLADRIEALLPPEEET